MYPASPPLAYATALPYGQEPRVPPVWPWFITYCVLMALMYLLLAAAGVFLLTAAPAGRNRDPVEMQIQGVIFTVMGLPLFAAFAAGPFLPKRPWVWIYNMVLICLGLTSMCCLPATIPLLIFWLKPETKLWFGRAIA
jgi:hypothetical protein